MFNGAPGNGHSKGAEEVIHKRMKNLAAQGGMIGVDEKGDLAMIFYIDGMSRSCVPDDQERKIFIYRYMVPGSGRGTISF